MTELVVRIGVIESQSKTSAVIRCGSESPLANSYPTDIDAALERPFIFMTTSGDAEREKTFRRAGLR